MRLPVTMRGLRDTSARRAAAAWTDLKQSWPLWFVVLAVIAMFVITGRINASKRSISVESSISVVAETKAPTSWTFDSLVS